MLLLATRPPTRPQLFSSTKPLTRAYCPPGPEDGAWGIAATSPPPDPTDGAAIAHATAQPCLKPDLHPPPNASRAASSVTVLCRPISRRSTETRHPIQPATATRDSGHTTA